MVKRKNNTVLILILIAIIGVESYFLMIKKNEPILCDPSISIGPKEASEEIYGELVGTWAMNNKNDEKININIAHGWHIDNCGETSGIGGKFTIFVEDEAKGLYKIEFTSSESSNKDIVGTLTYNKLEKTITKSTAGSNLACLVLYKNSMKKEA